MPYLTYILTLVCIVAFALGSILLLRRKVISITGSISILAITIGILTLTFLLHKLNEPFISLATLRGIHYLSLSVAATSQLFFSFSYANQNPWRTSKLFIVFFIEPILTQILLWIEPSRNILFDSENGIWEQIHYIYVILLLAASIILFIRSFQNKANNHLKQTGLALIVALFPLFTSLMGFISYNNFDNEIYLTIFSFSVAVAGFTFASLNGILIEKQTLTRDIVVESMDDGWMIVDHNNKIIDINSSAEKMTGLTRENIYGLPVDQILSEWSKVLQSSEGVKEMEMRRIAKAQNDWQYLNIRISSLINKNNSLYGYLVVWRDVTGRKLADEFHQRARDELFVLLNAISSLASRAMNLEDFLSESSYQIVYSFNSLAVAVYLTEEKDNNSQNLLLKSHFGFSPQQSGVIKSKIISTNIHNWLIKNEENRPLILNHQLNSDNVPFNPASIGFNYVALIPLIIYTQHENNVLGCLILGRNEKSTYTQDEVIRLTTVANQIATLIDSNRRRQISIALSERQRLLRDLHDSVSQKLYGLVALTEAAQAGIEAGSQIAPLAVLTRIGENARQAVKEMRLFLYEMQPIDLKDGLVASLQHRLAAVEGRADIKARMLSDENIELEKNNETALYYIAQEALNNILRHARAKNIIVNLKQTRQNIILEITDDGQGFDIKKIDNSGLGLRNMRERTIQANGKFKITSQIGEGTKIVITVGRKESS